MQDSGESWYYEHAGARNGPVEREKVRDLIRAGSVARDTLVWGGTGDWVEAEKSPLAEDFIAARGGAPPPLPGAAVDNRLAWALALVPAIGAGIEAGLPGWDLWWIYLGLYIGLSFWDMQRLKDAGYKAPSSGWAFLVPGYLWQRAALLKQSQVHFAVWVICFVATLFLPMA